MLPMLIASPTSPQDVQMTDLNILTTMNGDSMSSQQKLTSPVDNRPLSNHSPLSLSSVKSTNTLRNNIDIKNEHHKKRTSLNLHDNGNGGGGEMFNSCDTSSNSSSSSLGQQPLKLATVKRCSRNLDNARYRFELQNNHTNNDNVNNNRNGSRLFNRSSSSDSDAADSKPQIDTVAVIVNENGKTRRIRRKAQDKSQNGNAPNDASDDDDNNEFNDRRNGNASDRSSQKRDSITSKESGSAGSDDYFLCEKFKNTLNTKLCDAVVNGAVVLDENGTPNRRLSLELLSPHEGPLGRRYAEIAPSKNNTNNKW